MTRVLLAVDGTPESVEAGKVALRLFGEDAEFLVVSVTPNPMPVLDFTPFGAVMPMSSDEWDHVISSMETGAHRVAEADAKDAGLDAAEVVIEHGDPVEAICAAADAHDVDVIVLGSKDKGWLTRVLAPSIADGVVHRSSRPVLVVSGAPDAT